MNHPAKITIKLSLSLPSNRKTYKIIGLKWFFSLSHLQRPAAKVAGSDHLMMACSFLLQMHSSSDHLIETKGRNKTLASDKVGGGAGWSDSCRGSAGARSRQLKPGQVVLEYISNVSVVWIRTQACFCRSRGVGRPLHVSVGHMKS